MKILSKLVLFVQVFVLLISFLTGIAHASDIPNFGTCPNPGGNIIATSDSGLYSIAGDPNVHTGSDSIYGIQNVNLAVTQCFCPASGSDGIQTNWLDVANFSEEQISSLKAAGWINIPNGADWGLNADPYLAINSSFSCGGGNTGGGDNNGGGNPGSSQCTDAKPGTPTLLSADRINTTQEKITWSAVSPVSYYSIFYGTSPNNMQYGVANAGNTTSFTISALNPNSTYYFEVRAVNGCMPGDASNILPNSQVLGASTTSNSSGDPAQQGEVLGLASTGNSDKIALTTVLGLFSLIAFFVLRRKSNA